MKDQLLAKPRSDKQEKHLIKAMKLAAGFGMKQIINHDKKELRRQKTFDVNRQNSDIFSDNDGKTLQRKKKQSFIGE